jgi:histidine triad (HIT) family protein
MEEKTLFEKILAGEIPSEKVYEDDIVYAFKDINPQAPVHTLVIPKTKWRGFPDFENSSSEAIGEYMKGIARVAKELGLEEGGYRVVFNWGDDAQQTVQYVHAHIIGGRQLTWPPG